MIKPEKINGADIPEAASDDEASSGEERDCVASMYQNEKDYGFNDIQYTNEDIENDSSDEPHFLDDNDDDEEATEEKSTDYQTGAS